MKASRQAQAIQAQMAMQQGLMNSQTHGLSHTVGAGGGGSYAGTGGAHIVYSGQVYPGQPAPEAPPPVVPVTDRILGLAKRIGVKVETPGGYMSVEWQTIAMLLQLVEGMTIKLDLAIPEVAEKDNDDLIGGLLEAQEETEDGRGRSL
jgi:hypothetical protein